MKKMYIIRSVNLDVKQNNGDAHGDVRRRNLGYASVQAREAGWLGDENSMDIL